MNAQGFLDCVHDNSLNTELLARLRRLAIPDCHLVAGCLFQAVWNRHSGWPADRGVRDYDIFYFDDADLSWEAEDVVVREVAAAVADLGVAVDVKNQARVHLWYPAKFGSGYPQLTSARDGISRYLIECTCVGIAADSGEVFAPYGFADLERGILRINPVNSRPDQFREKALSYQQRWPWLTIADCGEASQSA